MELAGSVAVVTGGAGGIGAALSHALVRAGSRVVVTDVDADRGTAVLAELDEFASGRAAFVPGDCSDESDIAAFITAAQDHFGPVDLYVANAGVGVGRGLNAPEEDWSTAFEVNVLAHVRAARLLVPDWLDRGHGYFFSTASAAGLLTQIGSPTYTVTKHGAVAFAEWLAVTYGGRGVAVSCLCPMGVNTAMLAAGVSAGDADANAAARAVTQAGHVIEPEEVAELAIAAIRDERFLVLTHLEVGEFLRRKVSDHDRWIRGMQRYLDHIT